jgi:hypothetical protein
MSDVKEELEINLLKVEESIEPMLSNPISMVLVSKPLGCDLYLFTPSSHNIRCS